jgi:uncharacterized membrane protein
MNSAAHLWAIGFDDAARAEQVRDTIAGLAWNIGQAGKNLILEDVAVVVRHADGSFTFDRKPFPRVANIVASTAVGFLAGLVLAAPLTGAMAGAVVGFIGTAASAAATGIGDDFVREVEAMMKPGTSALFILDDGGNLEVIQHALRGLGGTVLKTNVDLDRARLIQSTLSSASTDTIEAGDKLQHPNGN